LFGLFNSLGVLHYQVGLAHRYEPVLIGMQFPINEIQSSIEEPLSDHRLAVILIENCEHIKWSVQVLLLPRFTEFEEDVQPQTDTAVIVAATVEQNITERIHKLTFLVSSELL
jgi:hypothetical protein